MTTMTEADLRQMMRDPRYWKERDPEFVATVREGFKALYSDRPMSADRDAAEAALVVSYGNHAADAMLLAADELRRAQDKHFRFNSTHEGYAVILDELDSMWIAIKCRDQKTAKREAVQVAAMALRFIVDFERMAK